jgi:hypothetical protein
LATRAFQTNAGFRGDRAKPARARSNGGNIAQCNTTIPETMILLRLMAAICQVR